MKLTKEDLQLIRNARIDAYLDKIREYNSSRNSFTYFNAEKVTALILGIKEVEKELDEKFPNWNECPF